MYNINIQGPEIGNSGTSAAGPSAADASPAGCSPAGTSPAGTSPSDTVIPHAVIADANDHSRRGSANAKPESSGNLN